MPVADFVPWLRARAGSPRTASRPSALSDGGRGAGRGQSAVGTQRAGRFSRNDGDALLALLAGEEAGRELEQVVELQRRRAGAQQPLGLGQRGGRAGGQLRPAGRATSPSTSASGTTRSTSPPAAAVSASNTSPVSISRCATCGTIRGSTTAEMTAGTSPSRTSEKAKVADVAGDDDVAGGQQARPRRPAPARGRRRPPAWARTRSAAAARGTRARPGPRHPPPAASDEVHARAEHPAGVVEHDHPHGVVGEGVGQRRRAAAPRIARDSALRLAGESRVSVATPRGHRHLHHSVVRSQRASCRAAARGAAHWEQMNTVLPLLPTPGLPPDPRPDRLPDERPRRPGHDAVRALRARARSARPAAATATSTPTPPTSSAPAPTAPSTPAPRSPSCAGPRATLGPDLPTVSTVFVGGGTPTLLPADDLAAVLAAVRELFPVAADVEVTTEANPEIGRPRPRWPGCARPASPASASACSRPPSTCSPSSTAGTRPAGRCEAAHEARAAGFEHVNLDLIYGTPGETDADWAASLDAVLAAPVDHVSAYALIVEEGTRLARRISRGELPMPDDDVLADRYEQADATLRRRRLRLVRGVQLGHRPTPPAAGTTSCTGPTPTGGASARARTATSAGCAGGTSSTRPPTPTGWPRGRARPQDAELLDDADRALETVMLGLRLRDGLPLTALSATGPARGPRTPSPGGCWTRRRTPAGRAVLTDRGPAARRRRRPRPHGLSVRKAGVARPVLGYGARSGNGPG